MFPALLVCVACLAAEPPAAASVGSAGKSSDLALYNEARARLGQYVLVTPFATVGNPSHSHLTPAFRVNRGVSLMSSWAKALM